PGWARQGAAGVAARLDGADGIAAAQRRTADAMTIARLGIDVSVCCDLLCRRNGSGLKRTPLAAHFDVSESRLRQSNGDVWASGFGYRRAASIRGAGRPPRPRSRAPPDPGATTQPLPA